ncbi:DinB family protein [uncultured Acinetobacter sp.]|uniref:DinB family protein n=1 Tax=uncultured Acinetobacter sp. TaxID=165433 RepID=UPI0025F32C98|nr:DinB family protein [uncultured Acinetobacter sp.]
MSKNNLLILTEYNIWATNRLIQSLESIHNDDFYKDVGLYFKSIAGTLNHLLLGEHYLWYSRFNEGVSPQIALDTIIHTEKAALLNELQQKSLNWIAFINQIDETTLKGNLTYKRVSGQELTLPFAATLMHVFNHGTHHRGQITAAVTALGYCCPELDLVYMLAERTVTE